MFVPISLLLSSTLSVIFASKSLAMYFGRNLKAYPVANHGIKAISTRNWQNLRPAMVASSEDNQYGFFYMDYFSDNNCDGSPVFSSGYALGQCMTAFNSAGNPVGSAMFFCNETTLHSRFFETTTCNMDYEESYTRLSSESCDTASKSDQDFGMSYKMSCTEDSSIPASFDSILMRGNTMASNGSCLHKTSLFVAYGLNTCFSHEGYSSFKVTASSESSEFLEYYYPSSTHCDGYSINTTIQTGCLSAFSAEFDNLNTVMSISDMTSTSSVSKRNLRTDSTPTEPSSFSSLMDHLLESTRSIEVLQNNAAPELKQYEPPTTTLPGYINSFWYFRPDFHCGSSPSYVTGVATGACLEVSGWSSMKLFYHSMDWNFVTAVSYTNSICAGSWGSALNISLNSCYTTDPAGTNPYLQPSSGYYSFTPGNTPPSLANQGYALQEFWEDATCSVTSTTTSPAQYSATPLELCVPTPCLYTQLTTFCSPDRYGPLIYQISSCNLNNEIETSYFNDSSCSQWLSTNVTNTEECSYFSPLSSPYYGLRYNNTRFTNFRCDNRTYDNTTILYYDSMELSYFWAPPPSSSSSSWSTELIVGVTVGCVVGFALIAVLFYYYGIPWIQHCMGNSDKKQLNEKFLSA